MHESRDGIQCPKCGKGHEGNPSHHHHLRGFVSQGCLSRCRPRLLEAGRKDGEWQSMTTSLVRATFLDLPSPGRDRHIVKPNQGPSVPRSTLLQELWNVWPCIHILTKCPVSNTSPHLLLFSELDCPRCCCVQREFSFRFASSPSSGAICVRSKSHLWPNQIIY